MMKKEINQSEAINQVALINSKNSHVSIINSPTEYLNWLIQKGKLEEAADAFAKVYKQMEKTHPLYPHYLYKPVEYGSKIVFEHRPANIEVAKQFPLKYKGKFSIKDKDLIDGETIEEFLNRKYFSQEKIGIDMKYIETWIGEQLIDDHLSIENHAVNEAEWFILPGKLPPPVKAKLVLSENETDRFVIDYLELRVTGVSKKENKITISNYHQKKSPIIISFIIPRILSNNNTIKGLSKFNIKIREGFESKVIAEKTLLEFMKFAEQSSKITLVEIENQKQFFTSEGVNVDNIQDTEYMNGRIAILSDLLHIENVLDVQFQLPEKMGEEDFNNIEIMKAIVKNKEIITKIENLNIVIDNKSALKKLVNDIKEKPIMITGDEDKTIELLGVSFENIKATYKFENLVLKDPKRIRKKLEYMDEGENAKVEFIPGTKNVLITKYKFEK